LWEELSQFSLPDPTYEQLTSALPYLDAVVHETLHTHPPIEERARVVRPFVPLHISMRASFVAKGSVALIPIRALDKSEEIWGPDTKALNPERRRHRHLLTYIDGPRTQFTIVGSR
ncbi:hypothetical protein CPB85DRAFT_1246863, partial [Mucidula mucida]